MFSYWFQEIEELEEFEEIEEFDEIKNTAVAIVGSFRNMFMIHHTIPSIVIHIVIFVTVWEPVEGLHYSPLVNRPPALSSIPHMSIR